MPDIYFCIFGVYQYNGLLFLNCIMLEDFINIFNNNDIALQDS